jgi:hypothetical protein
LQRCSGDGLAFRGKGVMIVIEFTEAEDEEAK